MSPIFTINFRREAYLKEVARTRRRVMALALWVAYFGLLVVVLGLYGLNAVSLHQRVKQLERQARELRENQGNREPWRLGRAELATLEHYVANSRRWHDRLLRLSQLQPENVRLVSMVVNPQNLSSPADQDKLVISGQIKAAPGLDHVQGVMAFVNALHRDSTFSAGYANIRLASTHASDGGVTDFVIECRR